MQTATHAQGFERRTDARERPTDLVALGERLRLEHAILRTALEGLARALPRPTAPGNLPIGMALPSTGDICTVPLSMPPSPG